MNIGRTQKRIALYVLLPAAVVFFGLRFYAQFRQVDVYVMRAEPMPAELASGLHMEEHKINPMVLIESPYDSAKAKILPPEEIRRVRSVLAWSRTMPALIDALTIVSSTNVVARRTGTRFMTEYEIIKEGDRWRIARMVRSNVNRSPPQ